MPSPTDSRPLGALLLTGGASRRMGYDKALIRIDGEPLARRIGRLAAAVAAPVFEVGPGHSGLPVAPESAPGAGPLAALADGVVALRRAGLTGPALVLATDLVGIDAPTLDALARWPGDGSVVPLLHGRAQPLCARWSAAALDAAAGLVGAGERSLKPLLARSDVELTDALDPAALADADTPADLAALGLVFSAVSGVPPRVVPGGWTARTQEAWRSNAARASEDAAGRRQGPLEWDGTCGGEHLDFGPPMTAEEWIAAYAARLGLDAPSAAEVEALLALAGVAAHASERQAAPVSTWLAARAGLSPEQTLAAAQDLASELG